MTLDEINQALAKLANSGDETFAHAATYVSQLIQQVQTSQLSAEDMAELLRDMESQMEIIQDAGQLKLKQDMNAIIKGVFTLASIIY
jgi:polyhydroxyalkanoate synthesis regulator phasin